jgi:aryl-alcohol dehydrogenase-like predicted oxidoreductase
MFIFCSQLPLVPSPATVTLDRRDKETAMRQLPLGRTGIMVSELCLGTMTWGSQNTEAEGHAQIDHALERGVTFLDTAEMYPTNPVRAETAGITEQIIGRWLARSGRRDAVVIASKVTGSGSAVARGGARLDGPTMLAACDAALARLGTDRIDLWQIHWPDRGSYHFRQNWAFDPTTQDRAATRAHLEDMIDAAGRLVEAGKIRAFGLSNDSAWGTAQMLRLAEAGRGPRVATIQNEYSLLCRTFDTDLAELCHQEEVTLLAFSPLAAGLLSGKYAGDVTPEGSRRARTPNLGGRITPQVFPAIAGSTPARWRSPGAGRGRCRSSRSSAPPAWRSLTPRWTPPA